MKKVEYGKSVIVHYIGKFEDGTIFDSSYDRDPFKTIMGQGNLIRGFETNILNMNEGEEKTFVVEPEDGYGLYLKGLVTIVGKNKVPPSVKVGDVLKSEGERGVINVMVKRIDENEVEIDANHPMAGKKLFFDVKIVDII
jgi:peptidylprolyl isomerase